MRPLDVLLLNDTRSFAGTERYLLDLAMGLRALGVTPRVAGPPESELARRASDAGLCTPAFCLCTVADTSGVLVLREIVNQYGPCIVHAQNGRTHLAAVRALARSRGSACVFTQHFIQPEHLRHPGLRGLVHRAAHRWVNRRTAEFIAISEAARLGMLARGDAPPDRITVVHNGIPPPAMADAAPPDQVRRELGIAQDESLVVCVARLEREKGVETLVQAMGQVCSRLPRTQCVVAGSGAEHDRVQQQIELLQIGSNVRLLGFRSDALALIRASDLVVVPSIQESFGLVSVEAMALGRSVVATRSGGPAEIVVDGETGLLVPPSDPQQMADAIVRLLSSPDEREAMGAAGHDRYRACFTAERMARETLAVYECALSRTPR